MGVNKGGNSKMISKNKGNGYLNYNGIQGPFSGRKMALISPLAFVAWTFKVIMHPHREEIE